MQGNSVRHNQRDILNAPPEREPEAEPEQASLIRKIQINFDEVHVAAIANRIYVYESAQLKPIDILKDHSETIRGLDVAQMLRNIVSFSRGATSDVTTFMVHCLVDSDHVRDQEDPHSSETATPAFKPRLLQDEAIYMGRLKWQLTYRVEMGKARLPKCLSISLLGDFCLVGGLKFVSLWTIDALMDSYTQQIMFAQAVSDDAAAQGEVIEETPNLDGMVCQAESCGSGRIFATLESGDRSLKLWHNDDLSLQQASDADVDFRRFYLEGAPIEPYTLPRHRHPINRFKFLDALGTSREVQPTVVLTVTQRKAYIWVESLDVTDMQFNCVHNFDIVYDAQFIEFPRLSPRADLKKTSLRFDCSKIFHSFKDKEKHSKRQLSHENPFGIVPSALGGTKRGSESIDWILLLNEGHIVLSQCKGLRNVPSAMIECKPIRKILFSADLSESMTLTRLLSSTMSRPGVFNDTFNFTAMNDSLTNLIKCTANLTSTSASAGAEYLDEDTPISAQLNAVIRVNPGATLTVSHMLPHPSLPLVALIYGDADLVQVYKLDEQNQHPGVHEPGFTLHGSFKSSKASQKPGGRSNKTTSRVILDAQWVGDMDQLLILTAAPTAVGGDQAQAQQIELVSSATTLKMLSLFGNRASLQDEVNKALGSGPNTCRLNIYRSVVKFARDGEMQKESLSKVIFLDSEVSQADQPHENPRQKICFAAVSDSGKSAMIAAEFQVDMDFNVCEISQKTIHRKTSFDDGFQLTKLVATKQLSSNDSKKTYALYLTQKNPKVQQASNYRGPTKKPTAQLQLVCLSQGSGFKQHFVAPGTAEALLEQPVVAKFSSSMLGILVSQGEYSHESHYLYLYSLESSAYVGFLDLNRMLGYDTSRLAADFVFLEGKIKEAIALTCRDRIYLLYQKQSTWEVLPHQEHPMTNMKHISHVKMDRISSSMTSSQTLITLHDKKVLLAHSEAQILSLGAFKRLSLPRTDKLHRIIIERQRSQSLFHPKLLAELYYKGYSSFVVKILLKLKAILEEQSTDKLSDYLDMDLESLLLELKSQTEQLAAADPTQAQQPAAQNKKATAFSVFDDLDESDSEEEKKEEIKEEETPVEDPKKIFKTSADALATLLTQKSSVESMGLDAAQAKLLVIFVLKFKNIFELDYYVDPLASMLLRKVFFETEKVDSALLKDIEEQLNRNEAPPAPKQATADAEAEFMNYQVEEVKPFSMEEYMAIRNDEPLVKSSGDLELVSEWNSAMVCQALHSENQEVILNFLAERFQFEKNLTWEVMRKLCIPIWLKDMSQIKKYIEYVAKTEYRVNEGRPAMCKADYAAIWYTLLGKKSVLQSLYNVEVGHERFAQFFQKDFTQEKTRSIAQKNGMALVAKQKNHLACSFLLLAGKLDSAVQVALDRLKDPVLAILMCRVQDPEGKTGCLDKLLQKWFIERGEKFNDPYLMNIGYWLKKEFVQSVNQLSPEKEDNCLSYFYKNDVSEFDLLESPINFSNKETAATTTTNEPIVYPIVTKRSYVILDLVKRLRKAPDVKRALNKAWANAKAPGKSGGAGSIFDDFLGGGSDSSSEEKEEEKKEEIQVDDSQVLRHAIKQTLVQRQTVLGLLLIEENRQIITQLEKSQVDRLSQTLLLDLVVNIVESENSNQSIKLLRKGLNLLSTQLSLQTASSEQFLLKQLKMLGLLKFQVEFLVDATLSQAEQGSSADLTIKIMEEQAYQLQSLVQQMSICAGTSLNAFDYDLAANEALYELVEQLQIILNCMLIVNHPRKDVTPGTASRNTLQNQQSTISGQAPGMTSGRKFNGLNVGQQQSVGDQGIGIEDSDEEEAKQEIADILTDSPLERHPPLKLDKRPSGIAAGARNNEVFDNGSNFDRIEKEDHANIVAAKFRTDLTLVMALQTLAILLARYGTAKDLAEELKQILGVSFYADQLNSLSISEEQLESLKSTLRLEHVKEHLLKIKGTLQRNIAFNKRPDDFDERGPRRRKDARNVYAQSQHLYDFLDLWFRQMLVAGTSNLLQKTLVHDIKVMSTSLLTLAQVKDEKHLQSLLIQQGALNTFQQFTNSYKKLDCCLQDVVTYVFARVLKPVDQRLVICEIEQVVGERYRSLGKSLNLGYFFSSAEKLKYFASAFELHLKYELLQDLQLGLTTQRCSGPRPNEEQADAAIQNSLLCTGIELFKQRQEPVVDICFDRTGSNDMMAMAIQTKGMREISVSDTLVYRNRREGGLEMIDEDQMSWAACLHRYEPIQQIHSDLKPTTDAVKAALYSTYYHVTATQTVKTIRPASALMLDQEASPPKLWGMQPAANYSKTYSDLRITHDDYSNAVEAHPFLPIYLSGNAKGLICMWNFNQMADKSLNQWMLDKDTPPNQANPKKATVKRIEFNAYGDKFGALNTGGQLFLMNFDLETTSKVEPLFSTLQTPRLSESRLNDFAFLDRDSVMAGVSIREKTLNIYDALLPPRQCLVQSHRAGNGGNLMQVCSDTQKVLCFNAKPGYVSEYDLRKEGDFISTKLLTKEEITATAISPNQDTLILGQSDGIVKIFDLKNSTSNGGLIEKAQINAFTNYGKKGAVSRLRFHPGTGALFAASNIGCVKLLRLAM